MPATEAARPAPDPKDWFDRLEALTRAVNRVFAVIACLLVLVIMIDAFAGYRTWNTSLPRKWRPSLTRCASAACASL